MRRSESALLLTFPHRTSETGRTLSRADIERAIVRGRTLQGEALRDGFSRVLQFLVAGCSLRGLRVPASAGEQRHSCC